MSYDPSNPYEARLPSIDRYTASWDAAFAMRDSMRNPVAKIALKQVNEDLKNF